MRPDLRALLACPSCYGDLTGWRDDAASYALRCDGCAAAYDVRDGIAILLPPGFDDSHVHDELDHAHDHKHRQASFFDREVAEEFEIERPHGAPDAYRWTLEEKFRRGVANLTVAGATVVDACCGSGMDAEMLERAGARVLAIDISEGCARRAQERARRHGLSYAVVVGDVERLPVKTRAADISFVHDGLHHLADPMTGVRELARVARRGASINEPAEALGTRIAVRLGLSIDYEGAGNRVARLRGDEVARELARAGFDATASRYFAYYRHEPGAFMRAASRPVARAAYRAAMGVANAGIARWGNKLQVTAVATPDVSDGTIRDAA
ncbi:MAG TPA: methyltransferase domain-containing protein [Dehalococcoidia bacterium]|nr:methyltransferase domain-containing protein [Dehalococcoidia bacterium]